MKLITKEWLNRAKDDLDVVEEIFDNENLTNMVAFHSQQAVEKLFKSIVEEFEIGFIKTHKLVPSSRKRYAGTSPCRKIPESLFGLHKGQIVSHDDLIEQLDP